MTYHLTGLVSALLYLLSLVGLWVQLKFIWKRKDSGNLLSVDETPTSSISINYCLMAYGTFFLLFLYGYSLERFNHYLVWPRLVAMLLTIVILYELYRDRRDRRSTAVFFLALLSAALGFLGLIFFRSEAIQFAGVSQALLVLITIAMGQGNIHQILVIFRSGRTGGVALKAHQLTLIKDLGTVAFGFAMGFSSGWPLILLCGSNAVFKLMIMYSFYWTKTSPHAALRRGE